ncbi:MAG: hypothetical protein JAY74_05760 [Candidatus Thiodiazotropha taylori]|nr:hypothetical protein [Candidatus Thiodiazotropha taylori]
MEINVNLDINITEILDRIFTFIEKWNSAPDIDTSEMGDFFSLLVNLDKVTFDSKRIHDRTESFLKSIEGIDEIFSSGIAALSDRQIEDAYNSYMFHLDYMLENFPIQMGNLISSSSPPEKLQEPRIQENILVIAKYYPIMIGRVKLLIEKHSQLRDGNFNRSNFGTLVAKIGETSGLANSALGDADKIILHASDLTAHVHVKANESLEHKGEV